MTIKLAGFLGFVLVLSSVAPVLAQPVAKAGGVRQSDIAATRAYLLADHKLRQTAAHNLPASEMVIHELIAHLRSQCQNVLAGAPATKVIGALRFQTLAQVVHAFSEPTRDAQIAFAKKAKRLRWSNHKLTYYIHGSAEEVKANAELVMPDMCTEARAITATGYQTTPPIMARYERQISAANSKVTVVGSDSLEEIIMRMLRPYERPDDRGLIPPRPNEDEKQTFKALERFLSYATEIISVLGLPAKAPSSTPAALAHFTSTGGAEGEAKEAPRLEEEREAKKREEEAKKKEAEERPAKEAAEHAAREREAREAGERAGREAAEHECVVPLLKGDSLNVARSTLRTAHCELGKISKPAKHRGQLVVATQSVQAGHRLPDGTAIAVRLALAKVKHKR